MSIAISIILILISIVLIVAVLMQEGNKQGLGAIGGAAETFMGKGKAKSAEGKLLTITKIGAAVFVVLAILATWWNARTYDIIFYNEDGSVYMQDSASAGQTLTVGNVTVPTKDGYDGVWVLAEEKDGAIVKKSDELPTETGSSKMLFLAEYTAQEHTLTIIGESEDDTFTVTAPTDSEIDYGEFVALPEKDGYTTFLSTEANAADEDYTRWYKVPVTMPAEDTTYYINYGKGNFIELYIDEAGEGDTVNVVEYLPYASLDAYNSQYNYSLSMLYLQSGYDYPVVTSYQTYDQIVDSLSEDDYNYYRIFVSEGTALTDIVDEMGVPASNAHEDATIDTDDLYYTAAEWLIKDNAEDEGTTVGDTVMGEDVIKLYAKYYKAVSVTFTEEVPEDAAEDYGATTAAIGGWEGKEITIDDYPTKAGYYAVPADDALTAFPAEDAEIKFSFKKLTQISFIDKTEEETEEVADETADETSEESSDEATEEAADVVVSTISGKPGDEISEDMLPTKEGYEVEWIDEVPATFPEEDTTIALKFVATETEETEESTEETTEEVTEETEETTEEATEAEAPTDTDAE